MKLKKKLTLTFLMVATAGSFALTSTTASAANINSGHWQHRQSRTVHCRWTPHRYHQYSYHLTKKFIPHYSVKTMSYRVSSSNANSSTTTKNNTTSVTSTNTNSNAETAARAWIVQRESGGSYTAQNGQYYGKYQLTISYLHGDLSAANQDKVANQYVTSRYGSWVSARAHWEAYGWY